MKVFIIKHLSTAEIAFKYNEKIISILKLFNNVVFNSTTKKWFCELADFDSLVEAFHEAKIKVIYAEDTDDVDFSPRNSPDRQRLNLERQKRPNTSPDRDYHISRKKSSPRFSPEKQHDNCNELSVNIINSPSGGIVIQLPVEINAYKKLRVFKKIVWGDNRWTIDADNVEDFYILCASVGCKINKIN
jgi:hypothetical protein